jgi:hypothetical protein
VRPHSCGRAMAKRRQSDRVLFAKHAADSFCQTRLFSLSCPFVVNFKAFALIRG